MAPTGVGRGKVKFGDPLFQWQRDKLLMVKDCAYAGTDFSGDPDLPLPLGGQWGEIGKKKQTLNGNSVFMFYIFYVK